MGSTRSFVLPALLLLLISGVWFCYSLLDGGASGSGISGLADRVYAQGGSGLQNPGQAGVGDGSDSSSRREEIVVEPLVDPGASATDAQAQAEEEQGTRLRGTVVRAGSVPVVGAKVVARKTGSWFTYPADLEPMSSLDSGGRRFEATTDEEGKFLLYDVPAGKLAISIRAAGSAPLRRTDLTIPEHEDFDLGRFQLELGIHLAGRVVGLRGKGVEGVQVLGAVSPEGGSMRLDLPGRGIPLTTTDVEGRFDLDCMAPGSWHLIFDSPQYRVAEKMGETEPAGSTDRSLLISLEQGLGIGGNVVGMDPVADGPLRVTARRSDDQPSGTADGVQGAERHRNRHAEVRADGSFEVVGLAPGMQYQLRLYRQEPPTPDHEDGSRLRWRRVRGVDDVTEMPGGRQVEFKYLEEATIVIQVKSAESGKAVERFYASVNGRNLSGDGIVKDEADEPRQSFPGGALRIEHLIPSEKGSQATLLIRAEGFEDFKKENLMLRPGAELDLGECQLDPAPIGIVKVIDDDTGAPIQGARVLCTKAGDTATLQQYADWDRSRPLTKPEIRDALTDSEGIARLSLWEGSICLSKAVAEGYQPGEEGRLIPPFEETVEIRLSRGGEITVRVIDNTERPVPGMYVEHKLDGKNDRNNHGWNIESRQKNKTGESGEIVFSNLAPGKHGFAVLEELNPWGRGGESAGFEAQGEVYLAEGESSELELRVESRGGLSLTILESGMPLRGALVKVTPVEGRSNNNGWYWGGAQGDHRTKVSDHTGGVKFSEIKIGRYDLRISHPDRRMIISREVLISEEPSHETIDVGLAIIEGRVIDPSGDPIEDVSITVSERDRDRDGDYDMSDYRVRVTEDEDGDTDWDVDQVKRWSISTDRDGRFTLRGVKPERVLVVRASSSYAVKSNREVGPLGSEEYLAPVEFVLERAGAIRVEVSRLTRQERRRLKVYLKRMKGDKETRSASMGSRRSSVRLTSMLPGTWNLKLYREDPNAENGRGTLLLEQEVTIRVGETTRVTLRP